MILAILTLVLPYAEADSFTPMHSCIEPYKPFEFKSQRELDNFNSEVDHYRECISNFIEEQNDAVRRHKNAAQDAIDEWNNYVNFELN
jgi:hypothetical protein